MSRPLVASKNSTEQRVGRPFAKGKSGNPRGRPKVAADVREMAKVHTQAAIKKLAGLMDGAADERTQCAAATALLDRGWGRPSQQLEHTGKDGGALAIYFTPIPDGDT